MHELAPICHNCRDLPLITVNIGCGGRVEEAKGAELAPGAGIDPSVTALTLARTSREEADAFLDDQRALVADQRHHLQGRVKHLHLDVLPVTQCARAAAFDLTPSEKSEAALLRY
jgi:hypothetical protein